jgi:hypothetical protein
VVARVPEPDPTRDLNLDEALGLNSAWYADVLLTLTC